jgi:cytochrome c-type biogenesis protein CcmH/NrfF
MTLLQARREHLQAKIENFKNAETRMTAVDVVDYFDAQGELQALNVADKLLCPSCRQEDLIDGQSLCSPCQGAHEDVYGRGE